MNRDEKKSFSPQIGKIQTLREIVMEDTDRRYRYQAITKKTKGKMKKTDNEAVSENVARCFSADR
jgi:hypothetical protein